MKNFDVLVWVSMVRPQEESWTYQKLAQALGLSTSQVFESVERGLELQLLGKDRKTVNLPKLVEFTRHALPYVFPSRVGGLGKGFALSEQLVEIQPPGEGGRHYSRLVWSMEDGALSAGRRLSEGKTIEPLSKTVPDIAARDARLYRIFSCVEVLRLPSHPYRGWAFEQIEVELLALSLEGAGPEAQVSRPAVEGGFDAARKRLLEVGAQFVSQRGFRETRLEDVGRATGLSLVETRACFASETELFTEITLSYVKAAGQFMGRLMVLSGDVSRADFKEVLRDFLLYLEHNEGYFRTMLWCYLQNDLEFVRKLGGPFGEFVSQMGQLMSKASGSSGAQKSPQDQVLRAYLFTSVPQWYAFFLWAEAGRFGDPVMSQKVGQDFKKFILDDVLGLLLA